MAGIAAGIQGRGLGFGDILVAEQSWDYGSGKMVETEKGNNGEITDIFFEPDTRDIQLSADLKSKINAFKLTKASVLDQIQNNWQGDSPPTKLQLHLGPIESGHMLYRVNLLLITLKIINENCWA